MKVKPYYYGILLFVTVLALYIPSIRLGFVYDDLVLITGQEKPGTASDYSRVFAERHFPTVPYYRPVTRLTFLAQRRLHDLDPAPYHFFNALTAAIAALAAFRFMTHPKFAIPPPAAAAAALLWAIHPVMSSCVYPICSGRETLLASVFMILAADAWNRPGHRNAVMANIFFGLALFAREQAVVLPVIFLLSDWLNLSSENRFKLRIRQSNSGSCTSGISPEKTGAAPSLLIRYGVPAAIIVVYFVIRRTLFGGAEFETNLLAAPFLPLYSYLYALQTAFFPFAELVYEPPVAIWWSWQRIIPSLILAVALVIAAVRCGRKLQIIYWSGWFILIQAPTANLLLQEAPFAERYVMLGALAIPALGASVFGALQPLSKSRTSTISACVIMLALLFAAISLYRARFFDDDQAFIKQWLHTNPHSVNALISRTRHLILKKNYDTALETAGRAVRLSPNLAATWYQYGRAHYHSGDIENAIHAYRRTLDIDPDYGAHYELALALDRHGDTAGAETHYRKALEQDPVNISAMNNLGLLLARLGDMPPALTLFEQAASLAPQDAEIFYNKGVALERLNRFDKAAEAYRHAIEIDPEYTDPMFNLAMWHFRENRFADAADLLEKLLKTDPDDNTAQHNLEVARKAAEAYRLQKKHGTD